MHLPLQLKEVICVQFEKLHINIIYLCKLGTPDFNKQIYSHTHSITFGLYHFLLCLYFKEVKVTRG